MISVSTEERRSGNIDRWVARVEKWNSLIFWPKKATKNRRNLMHFFFFWSALILRKLRKTNLTRDDPERSRKQVWNWYFKLTFGLQGKTIQRIMTPNFDRVSAVLSQKLYDLSLLLFINSKQRAGKCCVFKREKSRKYLLNSNIFFTM